MTVTVCSPHLAVSGRAWTASTSGGISLRYFRYHQGTSGRAVMRRRDDQRKERKEQQATPPPEPITKHDDGWDF